MAEKYAFGLKKVMLDGREISLACTKDGSAFGIYASTPIPQEDERRVGCAGFDIEAHRKFSIQEVDGNIISKMGLSEEAMKEIVMMYVHLQTVVGENK